MIWYLIGPHSITFNSNKTDDDIRAVAPDGTVHVNPAALAPAGGPGEPAKPPNGGSQSDQVHGGRRVELERTGFHSSGVFGNSNPPLIEGYKLTSPAPAPTTTSARCTTT